MTLGSTIHATAPLEHLCVLVLLPADLRRARKLSIPQLRGCPLTYNEVLDAGQADICQTDKGQAALVAGAASSCFQPRPVPQADQEQSQGQVMEAANASRVTALQTGHLSNRPMRMLWTSRLAALVPGMCAALQEACPDCVLDPRSVTCIPPGRKLTSRVLLQRLGLDHQSTVLVLDPCAMQAPTEGSAVTAIYRPHLSALDDICRDLCAGRILGLSALCSGLEQIFESRTDSSHAGNPSDALKELVLRLESSCKEAQQSCEAPCGSLLARHGRAHLEQPESGGEDAGRKRASFLAEQTPTTPAGSQQQEMPLTTSVSARLEGHAANGCERARKRRASPAVCTSSCKGLHAPSSGHGSPGSCFFNSQDSPPNKRCISKPAGEVSGCSTPRPQDAASAASPVPRVAGHCLLSPDEPQLVRRIRFVSTSPQVKGPACASHAAASGLAYCRSRFQPNRAPKHPQQVVDTCTGPAKHTSQCPHLADDHAQAALAAGESVLTRPPADHDSAALRPASEAVPAPQAPAAGVSEHYVMKADAAHRPRAGQAASDGVWAALDNTSPQMEAGVLEAVAAGDGSAPEAPSDGARHSPEVNHLEEEQAGTSEAAAANDAQKAASRDARAATPTHFASSRQIEPAASTAATDQDTKGPARAAVKAAEAPPLSPQAPSHAGASGGAQIAAQSPGCSRPSGCTDAAGPAGHEKAVPAASEGGQHQNPALSIFCPLGECGYLAHPTESWSDFDIETQLQEAVKREEAAGKAAEMAGKGTAAVQQTREDQLAQEVMEAKHQELQELGNFNGWREHLDLVTAGDLQSAAFQKQRVLVQESTLLCVRTRLLYSRLLERHALLCVGTSLARLSQKKQDLVDEGLCPQTGEAAERNFQQALQALWQKAQPTLLLEGLSRAREASQLELQYEACLDEARMEIAECLSLQREISNAYAWQHSNLGSDEELDKLQRCHLEMGIKYCMLTLISHRLRLQWATALRAQSECHLAEEEERMALVQVPWKPGMFLGHISRTCRQACLATHPAPPQPYGTGDTGLF
ncbi:hypothetical protein WJX74_004308 [Apatococcus lobatus]|uniref:Uncharacterized protein n=1 Tax=Apatococcus lobatus TaxID=904363 RepID=A0AAW1R256_9CHLO